MRIEPESDSMPEELPGELEVMVVESVTDAGEVVLRFFGAGSLRFTIAAEMVPYYRRLLRRSRGRRGER